MGLYYVPVFEVKPENSIWCYTVAAKTKSQAAAFVIKHGAYRNDINCEIHQVRNEGYFTQLGVLKILKQKLMWRKNNVPASTEKRRQNARTGKRVS